MKISSMIGLFFVALLVACGASPSADVSPSAVPIADVKPDDGMPVPASATAPATTAAAVPAAGPLREFSVAMKKFTFEPSTITVQKDDRVKFTITVPVGDTDHGLGISDFGVNVFVKPGETKTAEFTADKAGTFTIFCSEYCGSGHRDMKGTFIVEP